MNVKNVIWVKLNSIKNKLNDNEIDLINAISLYSNGIGIIKDILIINDNVNNIINDYTNKCYYANNDNKSIKDLKNKLARVINKVKHINKA
jgi:hypothetical protein